MPELTADQYPEFIRLVHGYDPFPWQERLARRVVAEGRWPNLLDLPTGSGKTSALDVALFAMAADPERAPRRAILVVDRRVVVDQGFEHARGLLKKLAAAETGLLRAVADRLRAVWGAGVEELPFAVTVMRGGMPRDDGWAHRPDQPLLAVSTVDQVGSRLLFRGYGVSPRMAPVHAGLIGNDTLILLDEVHLSVPFMETLSAIERRWRKRGEIALPDRWAVVQMSATPGDNNTAEKFGIGDEDLANQVLARRLEAHKYVRLVEVKAKKKDESGNRRKVAEEAVRQAVAYVRAGSSAVAIVVNRVDTARIARELLAAHTDVAESVLLTGRMRPFDRDVILSTDLRQRIMTGRNRREEHRPIVVVATQCIEAGADFDFDALVTECASIDALRQRFGRLDRLGDLSAHDTGETAIRASVLMRSDQAVDDAGDPVYGPALASTWKWLEARADNLDFGILHLITPETTLPQDLFAPRLHAPVMLPAHLDAWAQTSPRPLPDPEVALWLHGPERGVPDVQIVWRADITPEMLDAAQSGPDAREELVALLSACPPGTLEALTVPLPAARAWLSDAEPVDIADVVGNATTEDGLTGGRLIVRWLGDETTVSVAAALRPGDTLVVPSEYGGIRHGTWDPESTTGVCDYGDLCQWRLRGRATLRLQPEVMRSWLSDQTESGKSVRTWIEGAPRAKGGDDAGPRELRLALNEWLEQRPDTLPEEMARIVAQLASKKGKPQFREIRITGGYWTLVARHPVGVAELRADAELSTEDDSASFSAAEVSLDRHLKDVEAKVRQFARSVGLPPAVVDDVGLAASFHDLGKADPRFQQMLVGGSLVRYATLKEPLAKSGLPARKSRERYFARRRAGYPNGYRHEVLSVAMLEGNSAAFDRAHDRDLVLHLVGSHHGWCRPFAPAVEDSDGRTVDLDIGGISFTARTDHSLARMDSGICDRFWRLVERYGWWGLAWLEAIIRLSDHRASEDEQTASERES